MEAVFAILVAITALLALLHLFVGLEALFTHTSEVDSNMHLLSGVIALAMIVSLGIHLTSNTTHNKVLLENNITIEQLPTDNYKLFVYKQSLIKEIKCNSINN